ncbi:hypothetical protein GS501_04285 [Saccharibacter sp. 17.LH.SD]|nr:hypothetical protein [Saccharibacter sp. 17.LH.SD]
MGSSAHADRVLTDYEARKLTFSALIAPPVRHHHVARSYLARLHSHASHPVRLASNRVAHHGMVVRNVTYRGHVVSPHSRNTHHRHG